VWTNIAAHCKVWLGAEKLLIKDQIFRNSPMDHFGYLNMLPVVKVPVNSHTLISLYQLHSHTCRILGKRYQTLYKQLHEDAYGRHGSFVFVFDWPT